MAYCSKMNLIDIRKTLGETTSIEVCDDVQTYIDNNCLIYDNSECSNADIASAVKEAAEELGLKS